MKKVFLCISIALTLCAQSSYAVDQKALSETYQAYCSSGSAKSSAVCVSMATDLQAMQAGKKPFNVNGEEYTEAEFLDKFCLNNARVSEIFIRRHGMVGGCEAPDDFDAEYEKAKRELEEARQGLEEYRRSRR